MGFVYSAWQWLCALCRWRRCEMCRRWTQEYVVRDDPYPFYTAYYGPTCYPCYDAALQRRRAVI